MANSLFQTWTARRIAEQCGGVVSGRGDLNPSGLINDGRKARLGDLFVALKDQRDGHDFIEQARANGARCFLVERGREPETGPSEGVISVSDTYAALVDIGRALWREHGRMRPDRVAIALTGSNGKTTTKNMLQQMLQAAYGEAVLATRGNLNNHIGVPMMLADLSAQHRFVVLEMGASRPGDIELLIGLAPATRAIVTSIAPAHLEGFGDVGQVVREKGRIFCATPAPEVAVVPHRRLSDHLVPAEFRGEIRSFGEEARATVWMEAFRPGEPNEADYRIAVGGDDRSVRLTVSIRLNGRHNAVNLAAAMATAWDLLPEQGRRDLIRQVASRLEAATGRLSWIEGRSGCQVLDDTYNANPSSMRAALEVLVERPGRHWAILGDMLELGEHAPVEHRNIGRYAGRSGCVRVWAVGEWASELLAGAGMEGVEQLASFADARSCAKAVQKAVSEDDVVLVKGSRGVRLEQVVQALVSLEEGFANREDGMESIEHRGRV